MSEEKPSPVTYHEYNIPSLNSLFAWSAALLLLVSLWMVWADYDREWKDYQRRFTDADIARTKTAIAASAKSVDPNKLSAAKNALAEASKALEAKKAEESRIHAELDALEGKWYGADQQFKFKKAELDVARYALDEAKLKKHGVEAAQAKFNAVFAAVEKARLEFEQIDTRKTAGLKALAELASARTAAEKSIATLQEDQIRLEKKLAKIDHSLFNDWFRNEPLVDFLAPSIKVKQVILPDVHEDVNFMTVPRVDRCHTCHLAADKPGYTEDKLEPVFRTHSRADLLIGRNHPVERFGCTACHGGSGRAITFMDATHTPSARKDAKGQPLTTEQVAKRWEHAYKWEHVEHWDFPMLPVEYTEANCTNCHRDETRINGADKLNAGRQIIEEYGCWGCHKIDRPGYDELRKVGPSLAHLTGKVKADWVMKWVRNPKSFRPTTRMPRFFGNSNTATATKDMNWPLRDDVESQAVSRYVLGHSTPYEKLAMPSGTGDAAKGKWVVENRGCKACHVVGDGDKGDNRYNASFGPDLNEVGSKLTPEWIYAWVKNPKGVWPDTRMPNLRLTDGEALDVSAYLMTLRNADFEKATVPSTSTPEAQAMLQALSYEYLRKATTTADAKARLEGMDEAARWDYLGGKLISRYGCFACHDGIGGFEKAQPIGTELTTWASKLITQIDFGLVEMPHNKQEWLKGKLHDPRMYDQGKVETKDPQDLLKMPNFSFSPDQIEKIVTAVLGFQRDLVQAGGHRKLDLAQTKVEKGRRLYRQFNCQGCHRIDNLGGGMEKVLEGGKPFAPPVLVADFKMPDGRTGHTLEGAKVQPEWLFGFLKEPVTIRPWLNVRMPTFGMSDDQSSGLVEFFAFSAHRAQVAAAEAAVADPAAAADPALLAERRQALEGMKKRPYPFETVDRAAVTASLLGDGEALFKKYQCVSCHLPLEQARAANPKTPEKELAASLAPNLELARARLKYDWLFQSIKDPGVLQKDTRMPAFFYNWDEDRKAYKLNDEKMLDAERRIDSLRAHLYFHERPIYAGNNVASADKAK